jgi:diguanylate cyclase (GGDEF)-like protein
MISGWQGAGDAAARSGPRGHHQSARRIAAILRVDLRARSNFVARYGGEEFVVVLANSSPDIWRVAQRLRSLIEAAGRAAGDRTEAFDQGWTTISCGVATDAPRENMEPRSLIIQADAALYHAKAEGRNRVFVNAA